MADPKTTLLQLNQNLNILQEREAKYGGNTPLELLNQINDHQQAIGLTRQVITGELSEDEWREALKPLLLAVTNGQVVNIDTAGGAYVEGSVQLVGGDFVGRDQIITHIYEAPPPPLPPAEAKERHDLGILLNKVKTFWVEGVLEKSIHTIALIDLGKETQAEAVAHAWEQVLELPDQSRQTLPPDKKISQIFDEMNRALLILGEPGSGKTTTLLQLTQELIAQAEADETFSQPVPVVFNLSSWTEPRQPLVDWLVLELSAKYQIPKRIGRPWLENNRLLPLLDGLDEVKPENQAACVEAINHFGTEFGLAGLVVCSRIKAYTRLPVRLKLNGAIRLQPLTLKQIYNYLDVAGSKLDTLSRMLQTDGGLQELAQSPLILGIMSLAYQDVPIEVLSDQAIDTIEDRRKRLFDAYIAHMFRRKGKPNQPYDDQQTKSWLGWLAQKMIQHNQTIFLIEQMQPSWLQTRRQLWVFGIFSELILGLLVGLGIGLFAWLMFDSVIALLLGLLLGLPISSSDRLGKKLSFGPYSGQNPTSPIVPIEKLKWSGKKARKGLIYGGVFGLVFGLVSGLVFGLEFGLFGLLGGIFVGLLSMLGSIYIGMLFDVYDKSNDITIEEKIVPNQGIRQSAKNAVTMGLLGGLFGGLLFGLLFWLPGGSIGWLFVGLLFIGLPTGLSAGGTAVIQHFTLRFLLYFNGNIPRNYARFLDYAAGHIFLQKVGGGYMFIHQLLLEHFAAMEETVGESS